MRHCLDRTPSASLTHRECEVARLAAEGRNNREIADRLHLSGNTVKFRLKSVFQKLDIRSRRDLEETLWEPPL